MNNVLRRFHEGGRYSTIVGQGGEGKRSMLHERKRLAQEENKKDIEEMKAKGKE